MNIHEKLDRLTQRLAYHLWLQRGSPAGSPEIDWEVAEQMLADFLDSFAKRAPDMGLTLEPDTSGTARRFSD